MGDARPISREEMVELFGAEMPIEAVNLLWNSDGEKTCGALRAELRRIAVEGRGLMGDDIISRGDLRMIFTDGAGMATPSMQREMGDQVWALVGPIGEHTSHPELQDALGLVCMAFNRHHGRLSAEKHAELSKGHERGEELLRAALDRLSPNLEGE